MRLYAAPLIATTLVRPGVQLLEVHAPNLAQTVQPGQFCMVRCCASEASDPLLRRPFYVHAINRSKGTCTFYVHIQGRGTMWLAAQQVGALLDILGPLGHGWTLRPTVRTVLLIGEERSISSLTLLAQFALEQDIAITLINQSQTLEASYPPALLSPEVEYQVVVEQATRTEPIKSSEGASSVDKPTKKKKTKKMGSVELEKQWSSSLLQTVEAVLPWADAVFSSVSHETSLALYTRFERLRIKNFAQGTVTRPLACGTGTCFACTIETYAGQKLVCRDGPVLDLRDIVR